jgi:hypothetical protein
MSDGVSLAAFARRVLALELWPHQLDAADSGAFVTAIAKARRTGGTVLAEALAAHTAFSHRGCRVVILSATLEHARRLTESIGARLARSPVPEARQSVVDDLATRIRLANGSEILSLSSSPQAARGLGEGVLLVVLDEAGFMGADVHRAAHYVALDERASGSRIVMLGTPWGGRDHPFPRAFELGRQGDPDHASFQWTFEVNPRLDRAYLERQRWRVSPAEYAAEVLGEWSDSAGSLFPRELLERQTADVELPALGELPSRPRPVLGLDWGVSFDRSAAAFVYRLPGVAVGEGEGWLPRFVVVPHVWRQSAPLGSVVDEVVGCPASVFAWSLETSGVGAMPAQEVERRVRAVRGREETWWNLVATTSAKKTAGYGTLLGLLERGQLVLPRDPDLLRQLGGLTFQRGERGFTRIEAEDPAVHDDVADALMLAALPHAGRGGRVVCGLAGLADPRRAVPDATVGGGLNDVELVRTGGGLEVPRWPALQSIAGGELWEPDRVRVPGRDLRLEAARRRVLAAVRENDERRGGDAAQ